jgi:hypothetical protein
VSINSFSSFSFQALKFRRKEVIDSPSGSETKHFTHKDEFDQLYGTKASTKPDLCQTSSNSSI